MQANLFDLHSHILPGVDDGASDGAASLAMARAFVAQGVSTVACTPHILPGVYHNTGPEIRQAVAALQAALEEAGIPLRLVTGADNHTVPDFVAGLRSGRLLTIAESRYVLVEPPHQLAPTRLDELFFAILLAGYVPILTHPERLGWIEGKYELIEQLASRGVWIQLTSGSLAGRFGRRPRYWAERMLSEGLVHILASDAHNVGPRPPDLADGFAAAEKLVGSQEALRLVVTRPQAIVANEAPRNLEAPRGRKLGLDAHETRGRSEIDRTPHADAGGGLARRLQRLFGPRGGLQRQ